MKNVDIHCSGSFSYDKDNGISYRANFPLLVIRRAWEAGCDMEDLANGFGSGCGTMGGDWSGIRDSTDAATNQMFARAWNFIDVRLRGK